MSVVEAENELSPRRARGGGRDARQKARGGPAAPAYIKRIIPPYEMLGEDGLVALEMRLIAFLKRSALKFAVMTKRLLCSRKPVQVSMVSGCVFRAA